MHFLFDVILIQLVLFYVQCLCFEKISSTACDYIMIVKLERDNQISCTCSKLFLIRIQNNLRCHQKVLGIGYIMENI